MVVVADDGLGPEQGVEDCFLDRFNCGLEQLGDGGAVLGEGSLRTDKRRRPVGHPVPVREGEDKVAAAVTRIGPGARHAEHRPAGDSR